MKRLLSINSIIKFIERENKFVSMNRGQIVKYFGELIRNKQLDGKDDTYDNYKPCMEQFL